MLLLLFGFYVTIAYGENIYFKDGRVIEAEILEETSERITVKSEPYEGLEETRVYSKAEIDRIEKTPGYKKVKKVYRKVKKVQIKRLFTEIYKKWNITKTVILIGLFCFVWIIIVTVKEDKEKKETEEYEKKQIIKKDFWRVFYKK